MSVVVQCFHCNAILELDDGFRGGVCRCSACGSLLQVPKGDDAPPSGPKVRPAVPPTPTAAVTPLQNATSSKLDVGISRGQLDISSPRFRQPDVGVSSGLQRVHRTKPITASPSRRSPSPAPPPAPANSPTPPAPSTPPAPPESATTPRSRKLLWLALILVFLAVAALATMFIYYVYFYPEF